MPALRRATVVDRPPMPPPTTRTFSISPTALALLGEEIRRAEALLGLLGLLAGHVGEALHHRVGHRQVLPERRAALVGLPVDGLPVGQVVLPAAGVDLDARAAGLADVEVGDLVDAVDPRPELDRRAVGHEDLRSALDVEALVDAVGD